MSSKVALASRITRTFSPQRLDDTYPAFLCQGKARTQFLGLPLCPVASFPGLLGEA
jgi:hypothetical protein